MQFSEYESFDGLALAELVRRREVSAEELLSAAVERVAERDSAINAVVQNLENLAGEQIRRAGNQGAFSGVPFLLKDNGLNLQGTYTSAGSRFHSQVPASHSSTLTACYLNAGLVIFGKTNTPEFAISGSTESKALGKCRNPWDLSRGTGGSSGGAAAAVAAGYVPVAHGSDGGGSLRNPSSACGVFGLKPSRGRVVCGPDDFESVGGMSVNHVITRSVRDSAAMLDATAVSSFKALGSKDVQGISFLTAIERPPRSLRIAFHVDAHHAVNIDPECCRAVESVCHLCENLGHSVEPMRPNVDGSAGMQVAARLWKVSVAQELASMMQAVQREPENGELEWITQLLAEEGAAIPATEYADAINAMHRLGSDLSVLFHEFDVVLSPVVSQPPWLLDVYENSYSDSKSYFETVFSYSPFCWPYNMSGQPAMSVPLHWTKNNLPVGVQFAGRYGDEATLFRLARQLEQAHPWFNRRPPVDHSNVRDTRHVQVRSDR